MVPMTGAEGTGLITIVIVALAMHCPEVGINVYIVVAELLISGLQVPEIPLLDVVGKAGIKAPSQ